MYIHISLCAPMVTRLLGFQRIARVEGLKRQMRAVIDAYIYVCTHGVIYVYIPG